MGAPRFGKGKVTKRDVASHLRLQQGRSEGVARPSSLLGIAKADPIVVRCKPHGAKQCPECYPDTAREPHSTQ